MGLLSANRALPCASDFLWLRGLFYGENFFLSGECMLDPFMRACAICVARDFMATEICGTKMKSDFTNRYMA